MPVVTLVALLAAAIDRLSAWPSSTVYLALCFACDQRGDVMVDEVLALVPGLDPDLMGAEGVEALEAALETLSPPEARPTVPVPAPPSYQALVADAAARAEVAA